MGNLQPIFSTIALAVVISTDFQSGGTQSGGLC